MASHIGIMGGMGPMATVDLMRAILNSTEASCDQEHIPLLVDSNTRIPDRTAAIVGGGADPLPELVQSAKRLEAMGAAVLVMACNTAHYFYDEVRAQVDVPMMHIIRETAAVAKGMGYSAVGLLATEGTHASGIFDRAFEQMGVTLLHPPREQRAAVMDVIYSIKKGDGQLPPDALQRVADGLAGRGASAMILGCTELPLAVEHCPIAQPLLNPTAIAACRLIEYMGYPVRKDAALPTVKRDLPVRQLQG